MALKNTIGKSLIKKFMHFETDFNFTCWISLLFRPNHICNKTTDTNSSNSALLNQSKNKGF